MEHEEIVDALESLAFIDGALQTVQKFGDEAMQQVADNIIEKLKPIKLALYRAYAEAEGKPNGN